MPSRVHPYQKSPSKSSPKTNGLVPVKVSGSMIGRLLNLGNPLGALRKTVSSKVAPAKSSHGGSRSKNSKTRRQHKKPRR